MDQLTDETGIVRPLILSEVEGRQAQGEADFLNAIDHVSLA